MVLESCLPTLANIVFHSETREDRKSTRLNSSHSQISYAVFCLKKKTEHLHPRPQHTPCNFESTLVNFTLRPIPNRLVEVVQMLQLTLIFKLPTSSPLLGIDVMM